MQDLTILSYRALRAGYENGDFTPTDVVNAYYDRIENNTLLNAYITLTKEKALEQAAASEARFKENKALTLDGYPLAIKDLFCTKDIRTTAASSILKNYVPFYESTVTQQLMDAGVICLGKTNMDEFAMGSSNETSAFGPVVNPWRHKDLPDVDMNPGGSSGGSSAAVAGRLALAALGSDTGGSIRQPAALTGIFGLKPTYGRCSRYGMVAFASSLDQAGPMARSLDDLVMLFEHMSGKDEKDSTTTQIAPYKQDTPFTKDIKGLRVGIPEEYMFEGLNAEIKAAWKSTQERLERAGAEMVKVSLPHTTYGLPTYYIIAPAEASANLSRYDGVRYGVRAKDPKTLDDLYENSRTEGFGDEVKRRIMVGTYALSSGAYEDFYLQGLKVRRKIREDFKNAFKDVDILLTPTTTNVTTPLGQDATNPLDMYYADVFTVGVSLAGMPALSMPVGLSESGLPIGMQLIANDFEEARLFAVAEKIDRETQFEKVLIEEIK